MKRALSLLTISSLLVGSAFAADDGLSIALVSSGQKVRGPAAVPACAVCRKADEITQVFRKDAKKGIDATEALLEKLKFSKDQATRDQEILAVLKLCALVIPKDEEGTIDEYLYDAYLERTSDFDHAIASLPSADQKTIRESLKHSKNVTDEGNG